MAFDFEYSLVASKDWDQDITGFEFPEICQSSTFGEFIRQSGRTPAYIKIYYQGRRIGNCLIEISPEKTATWLYGPLLLPDFFVHQEEILTSFFCFLKTKGVLAIENAKMRKCVGSRNGFDQNAGIYTRIGESPMIDIRFNKDELLHKFDRSVRGKVNKCEKIGVEIKITEDDSLIAPYLELLNWYRNNRGFALPSFHPNGETMRLFNNSTTSMGVALALHEGRILAGMGFVTFGNVMTELALATSQEYEIKKIPVNDYLKIKAIEFYKTKGITLYDLAGGEKNPSEIKKKNILAFKQKFATDFAPYGMIDRSILSPLWIPIAIKRKFHYIYTNLSNKPL